MSESLVPLRWSELSGAAAVVITPGADEPVIRQLLAEAAEICGVGVVAENAHTLDASRPTLTITGNASLIEARKFTRAAIVLGDLSTAAAVCAEVHQFSLREGLGYAAWCLAHAADFAQRTGAPVVTRSMLAEDPRGSFATLLQLLGLSGAGERIIPPFCEALSRAKAKTRDASTWDRVQEAKYNRAIGVYSDGLLNCHEPGWWDRELFWDTASPGETCPEVIDITGRQRNLFWGPPIALGAGRWRATAHLELCDEAACNPLVFQFCALPDIASELVQPQGPGLYSVTMEQSLPAARALDFRMTLMRAAFHGEVRFHGVSIERVDDQSLAEVDTAGLRSRQAS